MEGVGAVFLGGLGRFWVGLAVLAGRREGGGGGDGG